MKHYAYYNMSRRTQLTTKYLFQVISQLSENFIFIYLGLDLFVESNLQFKPLFILVAVLGICLARYLAVFPLSKAINWFIRYRARRRGVEATEELPFAYQAMLFWAGLRGAVGVALAAGLKGVNAPALRATVLVVVVLTVIIFGGTTARMLEILGIRTGVVEELDSDDEFDIEVTHGGTYYKRSDTGLGYTPRRMDSTIPLDGMQRGASGRLGERAHSYSSGNNRRPSPPPSRGQHSRKYSNTYGPQDTQTRRDRSSTATLLGAGVSSHSDESMVSEDEFGLKTKKKTNGKARAGAEPDPDEFEIDVEEDMAEVDGDYNDNHDGDDGDDDDDDHGLPPSAAAPGTPSSRLRRSHSQQQTPSPMPTSVSPSGLHGATAAAGGGSLSTREALRDLFSGGPSGDHADWFRQLDEGYIKPRLLLDQSGHKGPGPGAV